MLAIVFGLSMDYEVFLMSRIREQYDLTGDNTTAVATGLQRTGGIITSAALLLLVVIGAFSLSGITFIKLIGVAMLIAIVVDATIVRVLLVPATMRLLGRANWWAPGPLRRLYARYGIRESDGEPAPRPATASWPEPADRTRRDPPRGRPLQGGRSDGRRRLLLAHGRTGCTRKRSTGWVSSSMKVARRQPDPAGGQQATAAAACRSRRSTGRAARRPCSVRRSWCLLDWCVPGGSVADDDRCAAPDPGSRRRGTTCNRTVTCGSSVGPPAGHTARRAVDLPRRTEGRRGRRAAGGSVRADALPVLVERVVGLDEPDERPDEDAACRGRTTAR